MHLNNSKGSKHEQQAYCALHAVDPKWDIFFVSKELHLGHSIGSLEKNELFASLVIFGGAIPKAFSFSLPSSVIQSEVQGGDKTLSIIGLNPLSWSLLVTADSIAFIAGHPEYVGVNLTITTSSMIFSSLMMPKS